MSHIFIKHLKNQNQQWSFKLINYLKVVYRRTFFFKTQSKITKCIKKVKVIFSTTIIIKEVA